jgi:TonB family protein
MNQVGVASGFTSILLLLGAAAGQDSANAGTPAASHLLSSQKRNAPCPPPAAEEPTLFDVHKYLPLGPGIHGPHALSAPDPEYSEAARKAKLNGSVVVALAVNDSGGIDDVKVVCSSDRRFEQPALDAVKQWVFAPGTKDGAPVAVQIKVEMEFRLY